MDSIVVMAPDLRDGGSVAAVAMRHAAALSSRYRVHLITRAAPADLPGGITPIIVKPIDWTWLRRFCHVPNELAFVRSARQALARLCARERIALVWCHSHSLAARAAAPLKSRFGFRLIMTTHGDIFDRPKGTYSSDLTWYYERVTPAAYVLSDAVHALSPHMGALAIRHGARPEEVRVIPNGVDASDIGVTTAGPRPAMSFLPRGTLRLLFVGSLWHVKGAEVLLRASALLARRDLRVSLVGDGPLRGSLQSLTKALGISDLVHFHGHVPRHQLRDHYLGADLLCVPSISEALPTVALEAMLCGLPVVGSNTGGIPSLVCDGVSGYLAKPGDAAELASAIKKAIESTQHLSELSAEGCSRAKDFAWPAIGEHLTALAEQTLAHRPSKTDTNHVAPR